MNTKLVSRWEIMRKLGKRKYIIKYGIFFWGIPMAILGILLQYFFQSTYRNSQTIIINVFLTIIIFLLGGLLYGLFMWTYLEKQYSKSKESE